MGTYYSTGTSNYTWKEFIYSEIDTENHKILQCSIKGRVAYLACESKGIVYGLVLLLSTYNGDKGYKPVDETMGPFNYDAPKSLIKKLTPTDDENAIQWRKTCLEKAGKPKIKEGDRVKFDYPVSFRFRGKRYQDTDFKVSRLSGVRGLVFESTEGVLVKIATKNKTYKIISK